MREKMWLRLAVEPPHLSTRYVTWQVRLVSVSVEPITLEVSGGWHHTDFALMGNWRSAVSLWLMDIGATPRQATRLLVSVESQLKGLGHA